MTSGYLVKNYIMSCLYNIYIFTNDYIQTLKNAASDICIKQVHVY